MEYSCEKASRISPSCKKRTIHPSCALRACLCPSDALSTHSALELPYRGKWPLNRVLTSGLYSFATLKFTGSEPPRCRARDPKRPSVPAKRTFNTRAGDFKQKTPYFTKWGIWKNFHSFSQRFRILSNPFFRPVWETFTFFSTSDLGPLLKRKEGGDCSCLKKDMAILRRAVDAPTLASPLSLQSRARSQLSASPEGLSLLSKSLQIQNTLWKRVRCRFAVAMVQASARAHVVQRPEKGVTRSSASA